jgi:anti-anti-sigma regulatory factor
MSWKTRTLQRDGVTVLHRSGRILSGDRSGECPDAIGDVAAGGKKKLLLNLSDVSYLDRSALGAIPGEAVSAVEMRLPGSFAAAGRHSSEGFCRGTRVQEKTV